MLFNKNNICIGILLVLLIFIYNDYKVKEYFHQAIKTPNIIADVASIYAFVKSLVEKTVQQIMKNTKRHERRKIIIK